MEYCVRPIYAEITCRVYLAFALHERYMAID
jgi:hypothetical protein